jgi:hypothetical protein
MFLLGIEPGFLVCPACFIVKMLTELTRAPSDNLSLRFPVNIEASDPNILRLVMLFLRLSKPILAV